MKLYNTTFLRIILFTALMSILWSGFCLGSGPIGYITLLVSGNGSIDPPAGTYEIWAYDANTPEEMVITAIPDDGWQFSSWSGPVDDPGAAMTIITIEPGSIRVTAQFAASPGHKDEDDNDAGGGVTGCFVQTIDSRQS